MNEPRTLLSQILKDFPVRRFFDEYYFKLPFAQIGGCKGVVPTVDRTTLMRLLTQPGVDFIVARRGQQRADWVPSSFSELERLLDEGYTVGIRHAERHDSELADLAATFRSEFGAPINIHVYCTPKSNEGFGWHYDAEEVFVLQTAGEKDWFLRKNTVNPWPLIESIPANQQYEREFMPVMHCRLAAGDWLYIPNGYWHRTAADSESISLSVGVQAVSALDMFDFLRQHLVQSMLWRQRLPCAGSAVEQTPETAVVALSEIAAALSRDLASQMGDAHFAQVFYESLQAGERKQPS